MNRKRALASVLLFLGYLLLALWWLWPLPSVVSDHSAYPFRTFNVVVADWYLIVWSLAWDVHALLTHPTNLFHANTFFPTKLPLAYSEHFLGYVPLFAPTYVLTGNPVLAANLLIILTYPLCAVSAYALARRWVDPGPAVVTGFFFAFHPFRYLSTVHFHALGTFYIPLLILFTDRWLEKARAFDAIGIAVALGLQSLCSFYLAYAIALGYLPFLALACWHWRRRLDRRRVAGLTIAIGCALVPFVACSLPYLWLRRTGIIPSYGSEADTPLPLIGYFGAGRLDAFLRAQSVGPVGYLLAAAGLASASFRPPRWAASVAAVLVVWGLMLSAGPTLTVVGRQLPSPYRFLAMIVPGLDAIRMPTRFVVVPQLGFALLAALGLQAMAGGLPRVAVLGSAAIVIALSLRTFPPFPPLSIAPEATGGDVPATYRWLRDHGGGRAVLELPQTNIAETSRRMYLSTFHRAPLVEGYSGYVPPTASFVHRLATDLPSDRALQQVVDFVDIGWIVVHRDQLRAPERARWDGDPPDGLRVAARFGSDLVLSVDRAVVSDRRRRLMDGSEQSFEGAPLGPVSSPCRGSMTLEGPSQWKASDRTTVAVRISNETDQAWPGLAVTFNDSLRARGSLVRPDGSAIYADSVPVRRDVPGRSAVVEEVPLPRAWWPGSYTVRVDLFQPSSGSLSRCGFHPLEAAVTLN
ncbi:MAG TPA: hypothetical protein VFD92_10060 [Candidatus Binatia bacterium]|nr:hypothetical protein [Candidatus Binatia bacterium]